MPRPKNTDERRTQISQGLIQSMARRGYAGASISEIARAAGLTPGLVHYHFKNKQEILLAALGDLAARHEAGLDKALARAPSSPTAQIAAFIEVHLGLGASADPDALACWVLISGEALRQPPVREQFAQALAMLIARLRVIITAGQDAGTFRDMAPAEAASALVAAIQGYFTLAATAREVIPKGSAASAVRVMAGGLLGVTIPAPRGATKR